MTEVKGNCYLCGNELGKTAMKNHILKEHSEESGQECRLLKIEGAYDKNYWLYVDIPTKYSLQGTTQGNGLTGGLPPVRFSM